ncbi:MAG: hypothetical protein GF313_16685 [Caldithrix sp.]|nr:hypothetical protein [Caldithrix sp.]
MRSLNQFVVILTMFLLLLVSCSEDKGTNFQNQIPDNAVEFQSADQAADFGLIVLDGVAELAESGRSYLDTGQNPVQFAKPATPQDTINTYYDAETGWWISEGSFQMSQEGNSFFSEFYNRYQFKKDGEIQKFPENADEMHTIMDINGVYDYTYNEYTYDMDMQYNMDLIYTNLQSAAIIINGEGFYDYLIKVEGPEGEQTYRYYFNFIFEDLSSPEDGYPTGKLAMKTKRWSVTIEFDGTSTATLSVFDNGEKAITKMVNLDEDV